MSSIFTRNFIYYQTPRTASNAINHALVGTYRRGPPVNYPAPWIALSGHAGLSEVDERYRELPGVCNVRNPFEVISSWFSKFPDFTTIRDMLHKQTHSHFVRDGVLFYHVPYCKFLIRYEEPLLQQINTILNHFGCRLLNELPVINPTHPPRKCYQEYYTQADIDLVWEMFGNELINLNYGWENV